MLTAFGWIYGDRLVHSCCVISLSLSSWRGEQIGLASQLGHTGKKRYGRGAVTVLGCDLRSRPTWLLDGWER